jgi:transcription termination factor NusB
MEVMLLRQRFPASDEYVVGAQSLSGMLTKIKTTYGSVSEMVEHAEWDEGQTRYFLQLIKGLHRHLAKVDKELSEHVSGKGG